jgi:hypothetical protein
MANKKPTLTEEESERCLDAVYPMSLVASHEGKLVESLLRTMSEHITENATIDDYVASGDIELIRNGDEIHILRCLYIIDESNVHGKIRDKLFPPNGGDKKQ